MRISLAFTSLFVLAGCGESTAPKYQQYPASQSLNRAESRTLPLDRSINPDLENDVQSTHSFDLVSKVLGKALELRDLPPNAPMP